MHLKANKLEVPSLLSYLSLSCGSEDNDTNTEARIVLSTTPSQPSIVLIESLSSTNRLPSVFCLPLPFPVQNDLRLTNMLAYVFASGMTDRLM